MNSAIIPLMFKTKEDTKDTFGKIQKGWSIDEQDEIDIRNEYKKR